ncbi:group A colicins tolerance protein [Moraxella macacae 0408225]|uniref:Group A colicins tolerance protein n=1 Tax=Moraxella macacae 0408225 TaxID=1230338 RepID=L2F5S7_9GAMM|nr:cell envelope integrity protein TolA [Moraxella macacae]ELA08419.1 group A colicins tolerance protein [Moraxella macacae 0408225]
MRPEVTSVYIPVKTQDYRFLAVLLSVFGHGLLLGAVLYFHSEPPPPPMQTVLISPEDLSQLQEQVKAKQQNNTKHTDQGYTDQSDTEQNLNQNQAENLPPPNPETAKIMQEIAQKEAEFQAKQAQLAKQVDEQHKAEQQRIVNELNQQLAEEQQTLREYAAAKNRIDEIEANLRADMERARDEIQRRVDEKRIRIESKNIATDGQSLAKNSSSLSNNLPNNNLPNNHPQDANNEPKPRAKNEANFANYLNQIQTIIDNNWHPPTNSNGKKLTVQFSISPSGVISNIRVQGSGDEVFKNSLKKAVQSSSPLPPPPADAYEEFRYNQFTFIAD